MDNKEINAGRLWLSIIEKLPKTPPAKGQEYEMPIWTDGSEILCKTEWLAETLADIIDNILEDSFVRTSYDDPEEDTRNNEVDEYTGWWCVDID